MKTVSIEVYQFDELSAKAKDRAREWYRDASSSDEWWESTYEDAAQAGLKITSFDCGLRQRITGKFTNKPIDTGRLILANHGEHCETFKTAKSFVTAWDTLAAKDVHQDELEQVEVQLEELEAQFLKDILADYLVMLGKELEYVNTDETVDENIRANEYEFDASGKRFVVPASKVVVK